MARDEEDLGANREFVGQVEDDVGLAMDLQELLARDETEALATAGLAHSPNRAQ